MQISRPRVARLTCDVRQRVKNQGNVKIRLSGDLGSNLFNAKGLFSALHGVDPLTFHRLTWLMVSLGLTFIGIGELLSPVSFGVGYIIISVSAALLAWVVFPNKILIDIGWGLSGLVFFVIANRVVSDPNLPEPSVTNPFPALSTLLVFAAISAYLLNLRRLTSGRCTEKLWLYRLSLGLLSTAYVALAVSDLFVLGRHDPGMTNFLIAVSMLPFAVWPSRVTAWVPLLPVAWISSELLKREISMPQDVVLSLGHETVVFTLIGEAFFACAIVAFLTILSRSTKRAESVIAHRE